MTRLHTSFLATPTLLALAGLLAACTSTPTPPTQSLPTAPPPPAAIAPVQTSSVNTSDLPPIGGTTSGLPTASASSTVSSPGFVSLDDVGAASGASGGRNLSGPLSIDMLLGGWTVTAGATECRLNLTYTARGATGRYRASAPGCSQPILAGVASWQLLGTQIQLYDDSDTLVGTMAQSGNRFVGTLSGGTAISMVG